MVDLEPVVEEDDKNSSSKSSKNTLPIPDRYASHLLQDWIEMYPRFVKVNAIDYKLALDRIKKDESRETEIVSMNRGGLQVMGKITGFMEYSRVNYVISASKSG